MIEANLGIEGLKLRVTSVELRVLGLGIPQNLNPLILKSQDLLIIIKLLTLKLVTRNL